MDDRDLKWESALFFFLFPFSLFPFSVLLLGPKRHHPVDRYPIPTDNQLSHISHTPSEEALQISYPLQRGPGTIASTNKYPKLLRLQQTDGVHATQILTAGEVLQEMTYLLLGYLHILRWKHHSYLSSVTVILGIPHFPTQLSTALHSQQPPVAVCSSPSSFSA